jgi:hypothetical protein
VNGQFFLIILSDGIKADIKRCECQLPPCNSSRYDIAMDYYAANKDAPILATYYASTDYSTNAEDDDPPPLIPSAKSHRNLLEEIK